MIPLHQMSSPDHQDHLEQPDFKMSAPYLQEEKKDPLSAYVEGSDSEGEVKSFSALLEEGKLHSLQPMLEQLCSIPTSISHKSWYILFSELPEIDRHRSRAEHADLNRVIEQHSDTIRRPQP